MLFPKGAPRELGFVRRVATLIGAAFVACALVYLLTRLVALGFSARKSDTY
jgi:hypothetical protein